MIEKNHVPALGESYWFNCLNGMLIFDDGVQYTSEEAIWIAESEPSDETLQAIHLIKKEFKGEITDVYRDLPQRAA